jgi:hypothetical protein
MASTGATKMTKPVSTKMKSPIQCAFWENPNLVVAPQEQGFELLDTYEDDSHWMRTLLKCRECGQLYFYEFYEVVDWKNGNDCQYPTYIPVETNVEIETLRQTTYWELLKFYPRLQKYYPDDGKPVARWIGK